MQQSPTKKFGDNMKKIRIERGLSQADIYRKTGLTRAYISNIEKGTQNITLTTIEKIAKTLGVTMDVLLK